MTLVTHIMCVTNARREVACTAPLVTHCICAGRIVSMLDTFSVCHPRQKRGWQPSTGGKHQRRVHILGSQSSSGCEGTRMRTCCAPSIHPLSCSDVFSIYVHLCACVRTHTLIHTLPYKYTRTHAHTHSLPRTHTTDRQAQRCQNGRGMLQRPHPQETKPTTYDKEKT